MSLIANLELYRAFYWTAREGNLSRAAELLFLTQPSISHSIKQLERELSVVLFHREARGVRLTEEGKLLYGHVERALHALEAAERQIAEINGLTRGELRVGGSDSLCKYYLLPPLGSFCSDYPSIRLDLVHGTTPEIIRYVKDGRIDFGMIRLPLKDDALTIRETITVQDIFVAGTRYAHLAGGEVALNELIRYPIVLFSKNSSSRRFVQEFALSHGVALEPEIELASVDLLIEFAKAGLGISFVTKQFVQSQLDDGTLLEIRLKEAIPPRRIGIVYLKNRSLTAATKVFLRDYLRLRDSGDPVS
jgi:LysR family transcriptional regulator, cyn operon transcriptional activator